MSLNLVPETIPPKPMNETDSLLSAAGFVPARMRFPNSWCGHLPFASWLMGKIQPSLFVELGTHTGNSYLGFCQSVKEQGLAARCHAVDTWAGDAHAGSYDDTVYQGLSGYHDPLYGSFSTLMRMTFDEAVSEFQNGSVQLLHIDGLHTYEAVRHDFETWLPRLAPGAIVLFHDTHVLDRGFGVWKYWEELCARYPEHLSFGHSNGLGVLRIPGNETCPPWMRPGTPDQRRILDYFTFLGAAMLVRYDAMEASNRVAFLEEEIRRHKEYESRLDTAIALKDETIARETSANQMLSSLVFQLRRSTSWRLTAPLRLAGRILKGDFESVARTIAHVGRGIKARMPASGIVGKISSVIMGISGFRANSTSNREALQSIAASRCAYTSSTPGTDPMTASLPDVLPELDICVVTYNSSRWVQGFTESLIGLDYPRDGVTIHFVDNGSSDDTFERLQAASASLIQSGYRVEIMKRANRGFGAGQNAAIFAGSAPYCLVTNVDLEFERDAVRRVVAMALLDDERAAAWELRQKPYEHPKHYDPVTGETNWNSHACVLLRRSALEQAGGYDETLFMYGEDVELSYRLRRNGHVLRYCPPASVHHYSYEDCNRVKPLQYSGSTFANLYIRLKYGNSADILAIPMMGMRLALAHEAFPGSRRKVLYNLARLLLVSPGALLSRRKSDAFFPFHGWDYEMSREGAFIPSKLTGGDRPLVSVVTRTYRGRENFLRQALLSVAHQTYPSIEHIVVEDGGESMRGLVENLSGVTGKQVRFIGLEKVGRSAAGNTGLKTATGKWCLFLDDDDLLFADHVEVLADALQRDENAAAAYSLSWEVLTSGTVDGHYVEAEYELPAVFRQEFDIDVLHHHNFMPIQSVLFERRLYLERGGFDEDMDYLEDWTLWVRYAQKNRFEYVPKVTSMFRTPADPAIISQRVERLDAAYPVALAKNRIAMEKFPG